MSGHDGLDDDGPADRDSSELGKARRGGGTTRRPRSVLRTLPLLTLLEAVARSEVRKPRALRGRAAVVVAVPSVQWVAPIALAAERFGPWALIVEPSALRAKRTDKASEATAAMAEGRRVLGVSHDPGRYLPPSLVDGADLRLDVVSPSNEALARAISAATFRRPKGMPDGVAHGLDFDDLASAIRLGSSAAGCVARLVAARAAKSVVDRSVADAPPLASLHGYGEAMEWCRELVADLGAWRKGDASFPAGARVVLSGPPGTGKTTLVRSLAKAADLPLVATSVGAWFAESSGNLDGVIKRIAEVWEAARVVAPSLVFLDELDALPNRATLSHHGRDWWLPVVNYVLTSLDGATSGATARLVVVGATNRASDLDAALIRPGRLERVIEVGLPVTAAERVGILRTHLRGALADVDLTPLAHLSDGMSGADLMATVRRAGRRARVAGRPLALGDLVLELDPPDTRPRLEVERCALHEAGHAVVATILGFPVGSVNVVSRGDQEGGASYMAVTSLPTREEVERHVVPALSGGATEEVVIGSRSVGMGGSDRSDIGQATGAIASLHVSYGLRDALAYRVAPGQAGRLVAADAELRSIVEADLSRLYARAKDLVRENRRAIERVAAALLKERVLTGDRVGALVREAAGARSAGPGRRGLRRRANSPGPSLGRGGPRLDPSGHPSRPTARSAVADAEAVGRGPARDEA